MCVMCGVWYVCDLCICVCGGVCVCVFVMCGVYVACGIYVICVYVYVGYVCMCVLCMWYVCMCVCVCVRAIYLLSPSPHIAEILSQVLLCFRVGPQSD